MENKTKRKLREGKAVVGSSVGVDDPFTLETMGKAGFDFVLIDTQHSPVGPETLFRMIKGLSPTESDIIVRVLWNDVPLINQVLDLGADGVIIPLVNSKAEAERAVSGAKYPPDGVRSWGPRNTEKYGGPTEYGGGRANQEILVLPQIETVEAVNNLDEILEVTGVDGIMIGPADLTLSIGNPPIYPPELPETEEMIGRVLSKCLEHKVPFGQFTSTFEVTEKWLSRGGQIAIVGSDGAFVQQGAQRTASGIKEMLSRIQSSA